MSDLGLHPHILFWFLRVSSTPHRVVVEEMPKSRKPTTTGMTKYEHREDESDEIHHHHVKHKKNKPKEVMKPGRGK